MSLVDAARAVRKRWRLVVICCLLGVLGGGLYGNTATPKYTAHTQLFVAAKNPNPNQAYYSNLFSSERVASYVDIIDGEPILQPVVTELALPFGWQTLAHKVTASNPTGTVLINIRVTDISPARARAIAAAVAASFARDVTKIESVNSTSSPVQASVTQPPVASSKQTAPSPVYDVSVGLVLGLLLGLALALVRDAVDTTIKDPTEIPRRLQTFALGAVPFDGDTPKHPLVLGTSGASGRAEAFRQLRTNLQFLQVDAQPRSILVTSSVAEEGKTTTACNLAVVLAQMGVKVILLEGDLRRPRVTDYLGLDRAVGLTSVLLGWAPIEDALQVWGSGDARLRVLPSGPLPPNPSELLASERMRLLLRELEDLADVVIIDGPPLLPVADSSIIAATVSGTLVVIRQGKTRGQQVNRALNVLRSVDAPLYGAVLNMMKRQPGDTSYYYRGGRDDAAVGSRGDSSPDSKGRRRRRRKRAAAAEPGRAGTLVGGPPVTAPSAGGDSRRS